MIYLLNFLGNLILGYADAVFLKIALNSAADLKKIKVSASLIVNASMSLITLVIPYTMPIPFKFSALVVSMVIRYFCFWSIFKKNIDSIFSIELIYFILLSLNINSSFEGLTNLSFILKYREYISGYMLHAVFFIIILILIKWKKHEYLIYEAIRMIPKFIYAVILIFFLLMSFFLWAMIAPDESRIDKTYVISVLILPMILCLIMIISIVIQKSIDLYLKKSVINQLTTQIEAQTKYYEEINNIHMELRRLRHDMKNHLICLKSLLNENEVERSIVYIDDIVELSNVEKKIFDTGSIIVDALLNDKMKKAASANAKIVFNGVIPNKGITNVDLCVIMANVIDNAIEALAKNTDRDEEIITIDSDCRQGYLFLRIKNRYFDKVVVNRKNKIVTSKKDRKLHGFGVSNIIATAKKYNGNVDINTQNSVFTMNIQLQLNNTK